MRSANTEEITKALIAAQLIMPNATMNKTNPQFGSRYADLASLREASLKVCNDNGLAITHGGDIRDGRFVLVGTLMHTSGQWIESLWLMPETATPQQYGSANTYAKRYTWGGLLGISSEEDDDANEASAAPPARTKPKSAKYDEGPYGEADETLATLTKSDTKKKPEPAAPAAVEPPSNPATGKVEPHEIGFQQTKKGIGADSIAWSQSFLAAIATAKTDLEISEWEKHNTKTLIAIEETAPVVVKRLRQRIGENYERVSTRKKAA